MKRNNRIWLHFLAVALVFSLIFTGTAAARNVQDATAVGRSDDEIERGVVWEMLNSACYNAEDLMNAVGNDFSDYYRSSLYEYYTYAKQLLNSSSSTTAELNEMYDDLLFIISEQHNPANHFRFGHYTVVFTNNGSWSDPIYFYNWSDDGGEISAWPGEAVNSTYNNEYGQKQYYTFIPMDVPNIVISSNQLESTDPNYGVPAVRVQTEDITVLGNTGFYLTGERDSRDHYKVAEWELKSPVYKRFYADPDPTVPTEEPTQKPTEKPTQPIPEGDYYVVLEKDNWALKESLRMIKWSDSYCTVYDVSLTTDDRVKVAHSPDGSTVDRWYPSAEDEGYTPLYNSQYYHVEFYPYGDGNDESYKGYIRATPCEPPIDDPTEAPTEPVTEIPTEPATEPSGDFNIDAWIPRHEHLEVYDGWDNSELQNHLYQMIIRVDQSILAPGNSYTPEYTEKLSRLRNFAAYVYNDRRAADNELTGAANMLQMAIDDKSYEEIVYCMKQWFNLPAIEGPDPTEPTTPSPTDPTTVNPPGGQYEDDPITNHIIGDADGDGEVTILDATRVQRVLAGYDSDMKAKAERYAALHDGVLNILDATSIQRWLAGFSTPYAIGEFFS